LHSIEFNDIAILSDRLALELGSVLIEAEP